MANLTGVFRLGKDAQVRDAGQTQVANLALAYNYGRKGSDGKKPTQWIDAALFGKRAEALEQYLVKGQQVYLTINDVHIETYEDRDGNVKTKLAGVVGDTIELVGGSPSGNSGNSERREQRSERREPQRQEKPRASGGGFDDMDDDIPF
jgi:single-strand DNA-binding protein